MTRGAFFHLSTMSLLLTTRSPRSTRLMQILAALTLSVAAWQPAASAQTAAAAAPSLTAGPDDLMRILPAQLLAAMRQPCHGIKVATPAWEAQLNASAKLLITLNQVNVPPGQANLPKAMLCPEPSALAAAWIRAAEQASNLVKLDFPGAPVLAMQADNKPTPAVTGASFIGMKGSRVLLVNQSAQPVRVRLGTWVSKTAQIDQYTEQAGGANPPRIDHLQRALGAEDAQGILLPPKSLSVVG